MTPALLRFSTLWWSFGADWLTDQQVGHRAHRRTRSVSIRGAGSTLAAPLWKKWIEEYAVAHHDVSVGYDAVGSGEGVKRFIAREVDFAGER